MDFSYEFSAHGVNFDFLKSSLSKEQYIQERRILEIKEIADSAADFLVELKSSGLDIESVLPMCFGDGLFPSAVINADTLESIRNLVSSFSETVGAYDKAYFAMLLKESLEERGVSLSEASFLPEKAREETFAYVKNAYADEAYDVFSSEFGEPRVVYSKSFKDALSKLESGEVGYCLLPLEERGARLASIGELIFRGDFKICSVTPVFGFDGLADMKYALVSRSFAIPRIDKDDDRYLEIRLLSSDRNKLSDILLAAKAYGVELYRINSSLYDTEGNRELYYSIVFRDDLGDFTLLLLYLSMFGESYTPVGIYKNLE